MKNNNLMAEQYKNAAILHGISSQNGDFETGNKQAKILKKIYLKIKDNPDLQNDFFSGLINNGDPAVSTWASAHCLGLGIFAKRAQAKLEEISKNKALGLFSFDAGITLKSYKEKGFQIF